jgi:hypothetical protein
MMFEKSLKEKFQRIFDLKKATFNLPGESQEQECLFIEIENSRNTIKDGKEIARVTGKIRVFGNQEKIPFGYFSKKIQSAAPADTKDLFFFDFEENAGTFLNIAERSLSFVYFFNSQYDPALGTITSIDIEVTE